MQFILSGKYDWTMEELKQKWEKEKWNQEYQFGFLVVCLKSENRLIGEGGLLKTNGLNSEELEVGYLIDKKYWRQGLGTEICEALIEYGFSTLDLNRITAGMYKDNVASAKIVQKLGMQLCKEGISRTGIAFQEYELRADQVNG